MPFVSFHKVFREKMEKTELAATRAAQISTFSPKIKKFSPETVVSVTRKPRVCGVHNSIINIPKFGVKNGHFREIAV